MQGAERQASSSKKPMPGTQSDGSSSILVEEFAANKSLSVSSQFLPEDDERIAVVHSSLGWELAHLLHVCLGQYLKPGGASPGVS